MTFFVAQGRTKVLGELFKIWTQTGETWDVSGTITQETSFREKLKYTGAEEYQTYRDLKTAHGEENADKLRRTKKEAQSKYGDAYPDVPHWMVHPDWPDQEVPGYVIRPFCFKGSR